MKKKVLSIVAVMIVAIVSVVSLVACGNKVNYKEMNAQVDALLEVKSGKADVAILDSTMAGYLTREGSDFSDLAIITLSDYTPEAEEYGVAAKKGNLALIDKVNKGIADTVENGKYQEIAKLYGLTNRTVDFKYVANNATDDSWNKIVEKGEIVIAYTQNAPMGIVENGVVKGFDIDLAKAIFEPLGITVKTKEINWDSKEMELNTGKVDLVWNGLTITEDRAKNMAISTPYLTNEQAFVVKKDRVNEFKTKQDIIDAGKIAIEKGSAAESVLKALGLMK